MRRFIFILFFLIPVILFGDSVETIFQHLTIVQIRERITQLEKDKKNSAVVLYLKGIIETDGKKAVDYYENLILNYPRSGYVDDARIRLGGYYYSLGYYHLAREQFRELVRQNSESSFVEKALYAAARCLIAMEDNKKAERELKMFLTTFPLSEFRPAVQKDLKLLTVGFENLQWNQSKIKTRVTHKKSEINLPVETGRDVKAVKWYTLQLGVFRNSKNALDLRKHFEKLGYQAYIYTKTISNEPFFQVCLNKFNSREKAFELGQKLNKQYRTDFRVVELSE
ncbi:SPOR domain-containing protein [bacterium]|nr:SPOR domain-containing protein [bacterium]